jgi:predicted TIM-barrel fold metal-dependent hydrolase
MKMVDAHAHVFLEDMPHIADPRHRITYGFTVEQYLKILDQHGVERGVIAAASPYGDYNDYTIAAVRNQPRLRGTVILEPTVERYVLEQMKKDGIVGVRLPFISLKQLPDLGSFEWQRTLRRIRDLDWHVHLHLDGPRLPAILPALEACGVKLVVDHFGRPDPKLGVDCAGFQMMLRLLENGRTWVKVSAAYRLGKENAARYGRELLRRVGADRLLWASDCPFVGHESQVKFQETIDDVLAWLPEGPEREKVFSANALAFYFQPVSGK